ncbi:NADPH:quinone reductase [Actinoalloteichus sp. AHMU CJ021]|uniref:NAD(P)H-dependent oxidoreductase n=1 Tax=Actinoalloteichus sp. AHMU CJ021 TaxID=2072503 RepID=UPI000CA02EDC|nr:NADPH:quinone reductase [Actinoalloteichus sp. AHMU CJ021]
MKVLWVFAHPEPASLSAALRDEGLAALTEDGHDHRVSDLYAMGWKAVVDREDFPGEAPTDRLVITQASRRGYQGGTLSEDILAEQEKLDWADAVVFQFPLWWYGMPAILKGWFDRVFVKGYAYGVRENGSSGRTLRYGQGRLSGKRALTVVTVGGPEPTFGPRGINGQLDHVLFPLLHGTLWYTGMSALPPVAVHGADRLSEEDYGVAARRVRAAVSTLADTDPIAYRTQNGGDYDDRLVLRPHLAAGRSGLSVHVAD